MSRCRRRQTALQSLLCKEEEDAIPGTPATDDTNNSEAEGNEGRDFKPEVEERETRRKKRKALNRRSYIRTVYDPNDMGTWPLEMFLNHCKRNKLDPTSKPLSSFNRRIRNRESAAATRRNTRLKMDRLEEQVEALEKRLDYYNLLLTEANEKNKRLQERLEKARSTPKGPVKMEDVEEREDEEDGEGSPVVLVYGTPPSPPRSTDEEESPCEPLPPLFDGMLPRE